MNRKLFNAQISQYATPTVSGEGSVTLEDNIRCYLPEMKIDGKTFQQTYNGYNLYDISKVTGARPSTTTTPDVAGNAQYGTVTDGVMHLSWAIYANRTIWTGAKIPIKQGGKYYLSAEFWVGSDIVTTNVKALYSLFNYTKNIGAGWASVSFPNERDTWVSKTLMISSVPDDWIGDDVYLSLQSGGSAEQYGDIPMYAKNVIISYGEKKTYEPYVGGIPSPNPGQVIPQYKTESVDIDVSATLDYNHYYSSNDYVVAYDDPIMYTWSDADGETEYPIKFSVSNFLTGNSGDVLMIASSQSDILLGGNAFIIAYGDGTTVDETFYSYYFPDGIYVGVGNSYDGMGENATELYTNYAINANIIMTQSHKVITGVQEIPAYPQEIENANVGMSVTLHGDNLFNQDGTVSDTNFTKAEYEGFDCVKIRPTKSVHPFPCYIPKGTYTVNFDYIGTTTGQVSFAVFATYEDGTQQYIGERGSSADPVFTFRNFKQSRTATMPIVAIEFRFYNIPVLKEYYFKNIMVNTGNAKPYVPYFREEIAIPTSVEVEGVTVPLLFTQWDKLTVDRLNNKVIYTEGSWQRAITGKENWFESWGAISSGYGKYYALNLRPINASCANYNGYSNFFKRLNWTEAKMYGKFVVEHTADSDVIVCATDTTSPVADFKVWLQEKYAEGNPVVFLVKRYTPHEHDITNTDLGQSLLNLATQNGTNTIEVTGNLIPTLTVKHLTHS